MYRYFNKIYSNDKSERFRSGEYYTNVDVDLIHVDRHPRKDETQRRTQFQIYMSF